jgi:hypothetical protein
MGLIHIEVPKFQVSSFVFGKISESTKFLDILVCFNDLSIHYKTTLQKSVISVNSQEIRVLLRLVQS